MPLVVNTAYTKDTLSRFAMFNVTKQKGLIAVMVVAWLTGILATCIVGIMQGFSNSVMLLLILLVVLGVMTALMMFVLPTRNIDKNQASFNARNTYVFDTESFSVESQTKSSSGKSDVSYSAIVNVYETIDFLYIYMAKSQAYIVDKNFMQSTDIHELKRLLQSKLSQKQLKLLKDK